MIVAPLKYNVSLAGLRAHWKVTGSHPRTAGKDGATYCQINPQNRPCLSSDSRCCFHPTLISLTLCVSLAISNPQCNMLLWKCVSSSGSSSSMIRPLKTCLSQPSNVKLTMKTVGLALLVIVIITLVYFYCQVQTSNQCVWFAVSAWQCLKRKQGLT